MDDEHWFKLSIEKETLFVFLCKVLANCIFIVDVGFFPQTSESMWIERAGILSVKHVLSCQGFKQVMGRSSVRICPYQTSTAGPIIFVCKKFGLNVTFSWSKKLFINNFMSKSTMGTSSLKLDSSDETSLTVAPEYCSWLTGVERHVVLYCCIITVLHIELHFWSPWL